MASPAPVMGLVSLLLRRLPAPLIAMLDGWSLQLARRKAAARRRRAAASR